MTATMHMGRTITALATAGTQYFAFWGSGGIATTAPVITVPCPCAGTLLGLRIHLDTAPGGATSRVFTIGKNGVDTALTVTVAGAATDGEDATHSVTFVAGDTLYLKSTIGGGVPAASAVAAAAVSVTSVATDAIMWGCGTQFGNTATNFDVVQGGYNTALQTAEDQATSICPMGITITAFYVQSHQAIAAARTFTYTIDINTAPQAATAVALTNGTLQNNATGLSVAVTAGDRMAIRDVLSPSATTGGSAGWGICYTPGIAGAAAIMGCVRANPANAAVNYNVPTSTYTLAWTATQGTNVVVSSAPAWTISRLFVRVQTVPGATRTWTFAITDNGIATGLSCALSGGAPGVVSDLVHSATIADGDLLEIQSTPTNTPNAPTTVQIGYCQNVPIASARARTLVGVGQ